MCGIAGCFLRGTTAGALGIAQRMADRMAHRGPDGEGATSLRVAGWDGALSHRRLSIIDLSADGAQPMTDGDSGVTLTFNGEIYNFASLRAELEARGHRFRSRTDTEVLLRGYLEWGDDVVTRLDGMFAFAIWDPRDDTLLLVRDRFGIKPLYYAARADAFVFASEVRAIIAGGVIEARIDVTALPGYLETGSAVSPHTLLRDIVSLAPGHTARWRDGVLRTSGYWDLAASVDPDAGEPADEEVRAALVGAVNAEMVSDVPIGVFLSGGIDSSALVSIVSEHAAADVRTVSLVFDEAGLDERAHSRAVAASFGTRHSEILVSAASVVDDIARVPVMQDLPSVDGFNTFLVARAAREAGLTVALSGLGGDEIFAGYATFALANRWSTFRQTIGALPGRGLVARVGDALTARRYPKAFRLLGEAAMVEDVYAIAREVVPQRVRRALLANPTIGSVAATPLGRTPRHAVDAMTLLEAGRYMLDTTLRQADIMSMAVSLEVRVPLLNHHLATLAMRTSPARRLRAGTPKPLIVDALPRPLPASIVHRRKGTFTLPVDAWIRGAHRGVAEDLILSRRTAERGLFDPTAARTLWNDFLARRPGAGWARVWALAVIEGWCREHLDHPAAWRAA